MSRIKRILVPTDFSPTSEIAFRYALDMAGREGASIHLLHVVEDANLTALYAEAACIELPSLREELTGEAQKRLDVLAAACAAAKVTATTQVLVGRASSTITEEADSRGSDLIVMGTHGRGGFAHLMIGSVAERVLRTAQCPVLIVRDTSRAADIIGADAVSRQAVGA